MAFTLMGYFLCKQLVNPSLKIQNAEAQYGII